MFKELDGLMERNQLISSDRYLEHSNNCKTCHYQKSDALFRSKLWRGKTQSSLFSYPRTKRKETLLLGHSDRHVSGKELLALKAFGFTRIFGINTDFRAGFSSPIPLGLTNSTNESELHTLFGNQNHLEVANHNSHYLKAFNNTYIANFTVSTNMSERSRIFTILEEAGHKIEIPNFSEEGRISYLKSLRESSFVICPVGNGLDTHRIWETLYMGGIPIIKSHHVLNILVEGLPVLILEDWRELLNESIMEERWYQLQQGEFDFGRLDVDYWIRGFCKTQS